MRRCRHRQRRWSRVLSVRVSSPPDQGVVAYGGPARGCRRCSGWSPGGTGGNGQHRGEHPRHHRHSSYWSTGSSRLSASATPTRRIGICPFMTQVLRAVPAVTEPIRERNLVTGPCVKRDGTGQRCRDIRAAPLVVGAAWLAVRSGCDRGRDRDRTGVRGFADRSLATRGHAQDARGRIRTTDNPAPEAGALSLSHAAGVEGRDSNPRRDLSHQLSEPFSS